MISVVIPNYNGLVHLKTCFDSLRRQSIQNFEIILVDNNSADNSVGFTREKYPEVIVITLDKNYGFSKTVNEGIKYSLKDPNNKFIVLLNNDVECKEDFLEELVKGFSGNEAGAVACKMLRFDDRKVIDNTGLFMDVRSLPILRGQHEVDTGQYDKPEYIFGVCAGAGIYKREVFETIGFFDEDFFAYHEDMDFNLRMQLNGYKSFYNPNSVCYHKGSATSGNNSNFKIYLSEKNIYLLRLKNYPIKALISNSIYFGYFGLRRFASYLKHGSFSNVWNGFKGFAKGVFMSKKMLIKRKEIKKYQNVSFYDIKFLPE